MPTEYPPTPVPDTRPSWVRDVRGSQALPLICMDAPVIRVEAGPGTGKTFGLVRRVARVMHRDGLAVPGREVLIVAFNRVIARELEREIAECLAGVPHDGTPEIKTVHALCLKVIGGDLRLLMDHEREAMLYDTLEAYPQIRARLGTFKATEQALEDHEALHRPDQELWAAVFRWLVRHQATLLSQLPGLLLDGIRQGDYEEWSYRHVIVDEFQDLTPGEQQLFFKLRKADGELVALGDPRQSIYAFRGNDRDGLRKLDAMAAAQSETVADVLLPECQRCPAEVVLAANNLMSLYPPPMTGGSGEAANLHVVRWDTPQAEARGMAGAILENVRRHTEQRHLVMVPRRRFGYWLRDELLRLDPNFAVDLSFSEGILDAWPVREAFLFASLLLDPDPATWRAWFSYQTPTPNRDFKPPARNAAAYLNFLASCADEIDEVKVIDLANSGRQPAGRGGKNVLDRAMRYRDLLAACGRDPNDVDTFVDQLLDAARWPGVGAAGNSAADLGLIAEKMKALAHERRAVFPDAEPLDLLRHAIKQVRYLVATREPFVPREGIQLQVTTLWGAKGVTADHVYLIGLCNEALPGEYRSEYPGTREAYFEEQRRLLYVSLTRAKKTLVLSRAVSVAFGEAKTLGLAIPSGARPGMRVRLHACAFLRDVIGLLPDAVSGASWRGCA